MFDLTKKTKKVLDYFIEFPQSRIHLRELARKLGISSSTAKIALEDLKARGIILEERIANLRVFKSNLDSIKFREIKKLVNLEEIKPVVSSIRKKTNIISLVLFGSYAKGTNTEKSDIDLLLITNKKVHVEARLHKAEINLIQYKPYEWKEKIKKDIPFYKEVIETGIVLEGSKPE